MVKKKGEKKMATATVKGIKPMEIEFQSEKQVDQFFDYFFDDNKLSEGMKRAREILSNHKAAPFRSKNGKRTQ